MQLMESVRDPFTVLQLLPKKDKVSFAGDMVKKTQKVEDLATQTCYIDLTISVKILFMFYPPAPEGPCESDLTAKSQTL